MVVFVSTNKILFILFIPNNSYEAQALFPRRVCTAAEA